MFYKYECGYGPKDPRKDPDHMKSIKCGYFTFPASGFTQPNVVEITFYHQTHIWANGDPAHGISRTLAYAPCVFHKLKEFMWTQLRLGYIVKQIYDKHKKNWWAWVNVGEQMTLNDFLWFQDITYLDRKHKRGIWPLHTNLTLFIHSWVCAHPDDIFNF
jgi:hypothetical protein